MENLYIRMSIYGIMTVLFRYEINQNAGINWFKENLEDVNELSSSLIKHLDLSSRRFFTLLPKNTDPGKVEDFWKGGIACQVRDRIPELIIKKLQSNKELKCIFDDVSAKYEDDYREELFDSCGLVFSDQIYYLVQQKNISVSLINRCLIASNGIWHSLCILFEHKFSNKKTMITSNEIIKIIKNTKLVLLGAYDGEGYVFWEKL